MLLNLIYDILRIGDKMQEIIIELTNQFGYFAILFLIAVENIFPPIPSEIILTFGGFMTTHTNMNVLGVIVFATFGSLIGAIVLYYLGRMLNKERLERMIEGKVGKVLRLKKKDIEKADHWFDTKGYYTVFFCRFIPVVRSLISIPAGMSEMHFGKFLLFTTIGSIIWNSVLVILGSIMGDHWIKIVEWMNVYSQIILILFVIVCIGGICFYYYKKRRKK